MLADIAHGRAASADGKNCLYRPFSTGLWGGVGGPADRQKSLTANALRMSRYRMFFLLHRIRQAELIYKARPYGGARRGRRTLAWFGANGYLR